MKVLKPLCLGMLTRPFEVRRRCHLGVSIFAFIPLVGAPRLFGEQDLWRLVPRVLGDHPVIDEGIPKSRAEFLVAGAAFPPAGSATTCPVEVSLGELTKEVHVVGDRHWVKGTPTEPQPFESMPIDWAHAFGGPGFADNPLGRGFAPVRDEKTGEERHALPNIEHPRALIRSPGDRPKPLALGPIDFTWPARARYRGTYDRRWLETRFPGFADDLDWRMWNLAQEDQQHPEPFVGDEAFRILNMHPERPELEGALPGLRGRAFVVRGPTDRPPRSDPPSGPLEEVETRLTTVWLFPAEERAVLVFQGSAEVEEDDARDVALLMIGAERLGEPRPPEHYEAVVKERLDRERGAIEALRDERLVPEGMATELTISHPELEPEGLLKANLRRRGERGYEEAVAKLAENGMTPEDIGLRPPEPEPPRPSLAELPARLDAMRAELEAKEAEAKERRATQLAEAAAICRDAGQDPDEILPDSEEGRRGPPTFRADDERERLRRFAKEARDAGHPLESLERDAADEGLHAERQQQEERVRELYRRGAHVQPPAHPLPARTSARLREEILAALAAGESLARRDLTGVDLSGADLSGADLSGAWLESANLRGATLDRARLDHAVLAHADLSEANLEGASLRGANLGGARLDGTRAEGGVDLEEATLMNVHGEGTSLAGAKLAAATFLRARLPGASFEDADLSGASFVEADLAGASFARASLRKCTFLEVDLTGGDLSDALGREATFVTTKLGGLVAPRAELDQARFVHGSEARGVDLRHTSLTGANLRALDLRDADLSGANLDGADLGEANLSGANLFRIRARGGLFTRTNLSRAQLMKADLMNAILGKANLTGADLRGASLVGADLARVRGDTSTLLDEADAERARVYPRRGQ